MVLDKKKVITWSLNLGLVLGVGALAWIFGPTLFMEAQFQKQVQQEKAGEPTVGFGALMYTMPTGEISGEVSQEEGQSETGILPISTEFGVVIPKIFANVAVTENVNPENEKAYQDVLRTAGGVAHAAGSVLPGEPGTVYIFGHSTDAAINVQRFNAVFYLLRKLEPGDEIFVYYKNEQFKYIVSEKKTVAATDITDITNIENEPRLVLQTCWPPGTTWQRLLIIAKPAEV